MKNGEIADPVHRYIKFTSLERIIIDQPITQRLRHISQTGLAQFVYPELSSTRFSHSLGVMHLASKFFVSSLRNADSSIRSELIDHLSKSLNKRIGRYYEERSDVFSGEPLESSPDMFEDSFPAIRLVEQSLRLVALFHDLGHLPFSHDFEDALIELKESEGDAHQGIKLPKSLFFIDPSGSKLHERIGRKLSDLLLSDILPQIPPEKKAETNAVFELAQMIFDSSDQPKISGERAAIYWLHTLVDGEIDVDRADYLLRDGKGYAFEFASFDISRLIANLTVVKVGKRFTEAILPHGISAVEDFLLTRYRSYQYGVRHHKVAQVGAALQHCIARMIREPRNHQRDVISAFLADIGKLLDPLDGKSTDIDDRATVKSSTKKMNSGEVAENRQQVLKRLAGYDDVWWMSLMRDYCKDADDEWFDLVCWRKSNPITLWKWTGDWPIDIPIKIWNSRLPRTVEQERTWKNCVLNLRREGVILVWHRFAPWEPDNESNDEPSSKLQVVIHDKLRPFTDLSRVVYSLDSAWKDELQIFAFAKTSYAQNLTRVAKARKVLEELMTAMPP